VKRGLRSQSQELQRWLTLVAALLFSGCALVTQREGHPTRPIRTARSSVSAELVSLGAYAGGVAAKVRIAPPRGAKLERAALVQPAAAYTSCPASQNACDPLDERFTTGTSAEIKGGGSEYFLIFPSYGALRDLAAEPQLLLDIVSNGKHEALQLELGRAATYRSGDWGASGAFRYRSAASLDRRLNGAFSYEGGFDRWLGRTRLHLGYELGYVGCRASSAAERASCDDHPGLFLAGAQTGATGYLRLSSTFTLGAGLSYELLWLPAARRALGLPTLRHGPRLSLDLLLTPADIRRFEAEPPRLVAGPQLAMELLFRDRFTAPRVVPSIAWVYGAPF
jgi:hypothetical protein